MSDNLDYPDNYWERYLKREEALDMLNSIDLDDNVQVYKILCFIRDVFEIAFGEGAIGKDFSYDEVVDKLREFANDSTQEEEVSDE